MEPTLLQWIVAIILLAVFSSVLLGLFMDIIPVPFLSADNPRKRIIGVLTLGFTGVLGYSLSREVMVWVWMGLRHLLGLDMEGV